MAFTFNLQHMDMVLRVMQDQLLFAKVSKCSFGLTRVYYLGHIISAAGIEMDPSKICAIKW